MGDLSGDLDGLNLQESGTNQYFRVVFIVTPSNYRENNKIMYF